MVVQQGRPCWIRVSAGIERREWLEALEHQREAREARTTREASAIGAAAHQRIILEPRSPTWSVFCFCTLLAAPTCLPLGCSHGRDELARDVGNARTSPDLPRPSSSSSVDAEKSSLQLLLRSVDFPSARARVERVEGARVPSKCVLLAPRSTPCSFSYHRATHARSSLLPLTIVSRLLHASKGDSYRLRFYDEDVPKQVLSHCAARKRSRVHGSVSRLINRLIIGLRDRERVCVCVRVWVCACVCVSNRNK